MEMVSYDTMEFGAKLRKLLVDTRHSQESLGELVGVSQNLVSLWCRGKSFPDIHEVAALSKVFGVSIDYLVDDEMDAPGPPTMTDRERMVWEFVQEIGADEAWKILVGSRKSGQEPAPAPGGRTLRPTIIRPGEETNKGVG